MAVDLTKFIKLTPDTGIEAAESDALPIPTPDAAQRATADGGLDLSVFLEQKVTPPQPIEGRKAETVGEEAAFGLKRGVGQLESTFYGLTSIIAEGFDSDPLREFAEEGVDRVALSDFNRQASIQDLDSIENGGDAFRWAVGTLAEQVPIMSTIFSGGGLGAAIARRATVSQLRNSVRTGAGTFIKRSGFNASEKEIQASLTRVLASPATHRQMRDAMVSGATKGVFAAGTGLESAGIQNELMEAGISEPMTAILAGTGAGALEVLPVANLINRMFPGVDGVLARSYIRGVAEAMGIQVLLEGPTEAAQEVVALAARAFHDPTFEIDTPANRARILESFAAGALVGAVTGGVGMTASNLTRGIRRAVNSPERILAGSIKNEEFITGMTDPIITQPTEGRPEADSLIPGAQELRQAAAVFIGESVTPILNSTRESVAENLGRVRDALGTGADVVGLGRILDESDALVRARVAPEFDVLNQRVRETISKVMDRAQQIANSDERAKFIGEQFEAIKADILTWAQERIQPIVDQADDTLVNDINTKDFGEEDLLFEGQRFRDLKNKATFGKSARVTRDIGRQGRSVVVTSRFRQRNERAIPFTTEEGALGAIDDVRALLPDLPADALEVVPNEKLDADGNVTGTDGFVIAITDIGNAEAIFEQLRYADGLRESRESGRTNPDTRRHLKVILPDAEQSKRKGAKPGDLQETTLDVPTLALAGMDINERGGSDATGRNRLVQGLDTMIGRLLENGIEIVGGMGTLNQLLITDSTTVAEARSRGQVTLDSDFKRAQAAVRRESRKLRAHDNRIDRSGERPTVEQQKVRRQLVENLENAQQELELFSPELEAEALRERLRDHDATVLRRNRTRPDKAEAARRFGLATPGAPAQEAAGRRRAVADIAAEGRVPGTDSEEQTRAILVSALERAQNRVDDAAAAAEDERIANKEELATLEEFDLARAVELGETVGRDPAFDNPELDPDQDLFGAENVPGEQPRVTETEEGLLAASKKAPNKRARQSQATRWWVQRPRIHASLLSVANQTALDVMDLAESIMGLSGLRNRILIVDNEQALDIFDEEHPLAAELERAVAEDPAGRIMVQGGEVIIYLSPRILIDQKNGDEVVARMNTLAVLSHELGHLIEYSYFNALSPELKDRLKTAHEQSGSANIFEEWMANQFVGWVAANRAPRNAVEEFFQNVTNILRQVWTMLRNQFGVTETFNEFMEGVTNKSFDSRSLNDFARHFLNNGTTGYVWFGLPKVDDSSFAGRAPGTREAFETARDDQVNEEVANLSRQRFELGNELRRLVNEMSEVSGRFEGTFEPGDEVGRRRALRDVARARTSPEIAELEARAEVINEKIDAIDDEVSRLQQEGAQVRLRSADFELPIPKVTDASLKLIRDKLEEYPGARQAAVRAWKMMLDLHELFTATLDGNLRRMNLDAANRLADILTRKKGRERTDPTYYNNIQLAQSIFGKRINAILDGVDEGRKQGIINELIVNDGNGSPVWDDSKAADISALFHEFYQYMTDRGLPVEQLKTYFPRVWDPEKIDANADRIRQMLLDEGVQPDLVDNIIDHMASSGSNEATNQDNLRNDPLLDLPYEGFRKDRLAVLNNPRFDEFRSRDLDRTVERYMSAAVKRAEFNFFFGEDVRTLDNPEAWNPWRKLQDIMADAREEGATNKQIERMKDAVDAATGRYGRNINPDLRKTMAWIATYQNILLLPFATLASLPDIVGPVVRGQSVRLAFNAYKENVKSIISPSSPSELNDMARTWGIIMDKMNQHILTEHFDSHWFPERARKINEKFFKMIGLERWTNMTRSAALAVGLDFIKQKAEAANNGDQKAKADLAELGLTPENVTKWIEGGEAVFGAGGYVTVQEGSMDEHNQKVAQAMIQFVNESIMKPNASQRPLWASNPALMLLFHLKSFIYSFNETINKQILQNVRAADVPWQKAYLVLAPGLMLMMMAALGLELRELIQYKLWGRDGRTDRMDGLEYVEEIFTRTGLMGPAQLAYDFEGAEDRGQLAFVALGGPALNQLSDFVSDPLSQTIPKAIPGFAASPATRQFVRDVTPLGD